MIRYRPAGKNRTGTGTRWWPSADQVDAALHRFFVATTRDRDTLRTRVVGLAVASAIGVEWSPTLAGMVRAALVRLGGRLITFEHRHLVCRIRPRHFDEADADALAAELRHLKPRGTAD